MKNQTQNSINYINKKVDKTSGFFVSSNYFNTVEHHFNLKLKEENFTKENGFNIPNNYFNKLDDVVLAKISSTKKETKDIVLKQKILQFIPLATAACIALFISLNSFIFDKTNVDPFENLADYEVENWLTENINSINDNDFAIAYTDVEFDDAEIVPNSISNDELENYLNNQDNISIILEND